MDTLLHGKTMAKMNVVPFEFKFISPEIWQEENIALIADSWIYITCITKVSLLSTFGPFK